MTFARLAYRPNSIYELSCVLRYLRREELKSQYARNTASLILRAICPKLEREMYSDFVGKVEGRVQEDNRSGREIIDDLIKRLGVSG